MVTISVGSLTDVRQALEHNSAAAQHPQPHLVEVAAWAGQRRFGRYLRLLQWKVPQADNTLHAGSEGREMARRHRPEDSRMAQHRRVDTKNEHITGHTITYGYHSPMILSCITAYMPYLRPRALSSGALPGTRP
jgi:hypothetical protein